MRKLTVIQWVLIIAIALGIILRLIGLSNEYLFDDEQPSMIAEMKFHRQSFYDGAMYFQEHPPLGKWLLGIPSAFIDSDYKTLTFLGPNTFVLKYLTYQSLAKNFPYIRLVNAIIGILAILFTFLIIKELFGLNAGLWSASLMSLSADFIGFSRHDHLLKIVAVAFAIMTIYFYIKYLKSKDNFRFIYLILTLVFFTFCIGSRNFDPLFLIPTLVFSQFIINRGQKNLIENIVFVLLLAFSFYLVFYYFYPPEAKEFARFHLEVNSPFDIIPGLGFIGVVKNMLLRNSYAYALASVSIIVLIVNEIIRFGKHKWNFKDLGDNSFIKNLFTADIKAVVIIFFLVTFIGLSIMNLRFGGSSTYNIMLYGSTFLIAGPVIDRLLNKKILLYILLLGIAVTTVQFMMDFPYGVWRYSNFGVREVHYPTKFDKDMSDAILIELNNQGNPLVDTDYLNTLLFYEGEKIPLVAASDSRCNKDYFDKLKENKAYILIRSGDINNQFICKLYGESDMRLVKSFGENGAALYRFG